MADALGDTDPELLVSMVRKLVDAGKNVQMFERLRVDGEVRATRWITITNVIGMDEPMRGLVTFQGTLWFANGDTSAYNLVRSIRDLSHYRISRDENCWRIDNET